MEFTDHEMTLATEAAALFLFTHRNPWRRKSAPARWAALDKVAKYPMLSTAGEILLPIMAALPERPTVGAPIVFTVDEVRAAAMEGTKVRFERKKPGAWARMAPGRQARHATPGTLVARAAINALPMRKDPEAPLEVPDFIPDDLV